MRRFFTHFLGPLEDTSLNDVKQCLCEEWDAVSKLENKAKEAASKEEAKEELKEATVKFQQKEEEKKKENNEEAQEKATEEIVVNELKKEGKYKSEGACIA